MKKIIFTNLVMQEPFLCKYEVDNSKELEYEHKVFFPINAILAKTLNKCDDVKVVIIKRDNIANNNEKNEKLLKDELNKINEKIGANITYKTLNYEYVEKISIHEKIIKDLIDEIEENAHILADITYGPKPQMISIFTALRFAEKFFNCEVDSIIYGKTEFVEENGVTKSSKSVIFDMLNIYLIDSLTATMEFKDGDDAKKALNLILSF